MRPVLALHGWLDNCASFEPLIPLLNNVHVLALDLAGHGRSGHRTPGKPYNIWDDVGEVFAVADQMGWDTFSLLGHSRGAAISTLSAGTFPERIRSCSLVDGLVPMMEPASEAPKQLAASILEVQALEKKSLRVFDSLDSATQARRRGHFRLSLEAARLLTERGTKEVEGGISWSSDNRLMAASAMKLTMDHLQAFMQNVSAPVKLVLADNDSSMLATHLHRFESMLPSFSVEKVKGTHHLHMEEERRQVADIFNRHLDDTGA